MTLAAVGLAAVQLQQWRWDLWWRPVAVLLAGYFLQWLGHRIEGNDMGEVILVKRLLSRPYVAVAPRYQQTPAVPTRPAPAARGNPSRTAVGPNPRSKIQNPR